MSNILTRDRDLINEQFSAFNNQMSEQDQINLMREYANKHVAVWHKLMGGGTKDALDKMKSGGLLNYYIENDKGFREFVEAQTNEEKINVVKKYRKNNQGWEYADTDEDIFERLKTHGLSFVAPEKPYPKGVVY